MHGIILNQHCRIKQAQIIHYAEILKELSDPRVRQVYTNELFPQRTTNITDVVTPTFDMAYYPTDSGPYNFTDDAADSRCEWKIEKSRKNDGAVSCAVLIKQILKPVTFNI